MATETAQASAVPEEMPIETEAPEVAADVRQEAPAEPELAVTEEAREEVKEECQASKDEETKDAQAEADAPMEDRAEEKPAEAGPAEQQVAAAEEMPTAVAVAKTPPAKVSASRKKDKGAPKGPDLAAMALKIKRLQDEAMAIDTAISEKDKKIRGLEAEKAALTSEAQAKRHAAHKVSQEYTRKKCEVAIAKLEGDVPKKPLNAYVMFCMENILAGVAAHEMNKKRTEMWQNLGPEEKKKYTDRYEVEMKRFREWNATEEGQKNYRERTELVRQIKATGEEELAKALGSSVEAPSGVPSKRPVHAAQDTPVKHRRVTPAEPVFDDKVLEEASKADLVSQLKNLAGRPEVVALGKSMQEVWDVLKANSGMVNAAKRALVGA